VPPSAGDRGSLWMSRTITTRSVADKFLGPEGERGEETVVRKGGKRGQRRSRGRRRNGGGSATAEGNLRFIPRAPREVTLMCQKMAPGHPVSHPSLRMQPAAPPRACTTRNDPLRRFLACRLAGVFCTPPARPPNAGPTPNGPGHQVSLAPERTLCAHRRRLK
jgi:hypothetical protein